MWYLVAVSSVMGNRRGNNSRQYFMVIESCHIANCGSARDVWGVGRGVGGGCDVGGTIAFLYFFVPYWISRQNAIMSRLGIDSAT